MIDLTHHPRFAQPLLDVHDELIIALGGSLSSSRPCLRACPKPLSGGIVGAVFLHMLAWRQAFEVIKRVVQRVAVLVVDHLSAWQWAIHLLPNVDGSLSPLIGFCDLDPRAHHASLIGSDSLRADRELVVGTLPAGELRTRREARHCRYARLGASA